MANQTLQQTLDKLLPTIKGQSLLLHSCCGPCSTYVLEYLAQFLSITLYYYNPNIAPPAEYHRRLQEQQAVLERLDLPYPVTFLAGDYTPAVFYTAVKGLELEPEGGARCEVCFRLRLAEAAAKAKELGLDYFATTLSISPHKDSALLEIISEQVSEIYEIPHLPSDFKKKGGYQRSLVLSREFELYRQYYCGCSFSISEESQ